MITGKSISKVSVKAESLTQKTTSIINTAVEIYNNNIADNHNYTISDSITIAIMRQTETCNYAISVSSITVIDLVSVCRG